ncbi:hypothetical protein ASE01_20285 [Nocardioides sp. Root190]|uniref:hypothetical protein n=1 Tax=Nocardioides sp. Root190 TaxID=1736488 RepID=UPI0006F44915|nr:hypothetical protein [Nocardioides sp. Root190]KRB73113.1 hypothetical protein ASE01_20285 [Nocardioides sp. Root190]
MILAHGLGGGSDLPISASSAVIGGCAALTVSFTVLLLAWRTPRFEGAAGSRLLVPKLTRFVDATVTRIMLRLFGLVALGFAVWVAAAGPDEPSVNPLFGMFYVLLWVGLVPASLALGPVVKAVSPARSLTFAVSAALRIDSGRPRVRLPQWVGMWPAAVGLLAFVWTELVSPDGSTLATVSTWLLVYVAAMVVGGCLFGTDWFEQADPFEVYSTLVAHLSIWRRNTHGVLEVVAPLRNLAGLTARPGLLAVTSVLLGSTAFDSFAGSTTWLRFTQSTSLDVALLETGLLLGVCALVAGLFWTATSIPARSARVPRREMPGRLAHSLVPIIVGYMTAHYLTLLVETGQQTLIQASDPLGTGQNLFGTADLQVDIWLSLHPTVLASIKVLAIVIGHVLGVIAAHDRAITLLPSRDHSTAQLPLLFVMVSYTFAGLYLLFGL